MNQYEVTFTPLAKFPTLFSISLHTAAPTPKAAERLASLTLVKEGFSRSHFKKAVAVKEVG